eukprot:755587-Hanusia_phi.AAC.9
MVGDNTFSQPSLVKWAASASNTYVGVVDGRLVKHFPANGAHAIPIGREEWRTRGGQSEEEERRGEMRPEERRGEDGRGEERLMS